MMIAGDLGVFPWYPYPYPQYPYSPQQVWVLMGKGKGLEGLEGLAGFDTLNGFVVSIKGISTHMSQWMTGLMYYLNFYPYVDIK